MYLLASDKVKRKILPECKFVSYSIIRDVILRPE
jgi:hypothetical protein